jgi:O-antigen/teichoic acid export membrane protein
MQHFRDIKKMTSSFFVNLTCGSIRSVIVMQILGPTLMGAWKSALLLDSIGDWARLGVSRGASLQVPILDAQNNKQEADRTASAAGTFNLLLAMVLFVGIFCASFFVRNADVRLAMRLIAIVTAVCQPYYALRDLASARHLFDVRSRETLLRAVVDLGAAIALTKLFRLAGFGIASVLPTLAGALYLQHHVRLRFGLRPDTARVKNLVACGFPYSLTEAAFELVRRLDVLVMALVLGPTFVGLYGIAFLIMDFAAVLAQKGMAEVLSPHLLREFGRTGSFSNVVMFYERPARLFCYVLPPVLGVGALLLPECVRLALPKYLPGVPAAEITLWAVFFVAVHGSMSSFFVAAGKVPVVLRLYAVLACAGAAAQFLVMRGGLGLTGVAFTTLVTLALVSSGEMIIARRVCGHSFAEIIPFLGSLYFPLAAVSVLRIFVGSLRLGTLVPTPLELPSKIILLLLFYAPVLLAYENRFAMLRTICQTI